MVVHVQMSHWMGIAVPLRHGTKREAERLQARARVLGFLMNASSACHYYLALCIGHDQSPEYVATALLLLT
jgi:hypothetical protein